MALLDCTCKSCGKIIKDIQCGNCKRSNFTVSFMMPEEESFLSPAYGGYIKLVCPHCKVTSPFYQMNFFDCKDGKYTGQMEINSDECSSKIVVVPQDILPVRKEVEKLGKSGCAATFLVFITIPFLLLVVTLHNVSLLI